MMLHNEKDLFETLVIEASEKLGIVPVTLSFATISLSSSIT